MVLFDDGWPRKRLSAQMVWFGCWAAVTGVAAFLRPNIHHHGTHTQLGLPPCPSVLLFHRPCPGCGLTTSWTAFVHGDLAASFAAHPLGPVLYLAFATSALLGAYGWSTGKRMRTESRPANFGLLAILIGLIGIGAWRFATTVYSDPFPAPYAIFSMSRTSQEGRQAARVPEKDTSSQLAAPGH